MIPFLCDGSVIDKSLTPKIMLSDCISCTAVEEINGIFECTLTFPRNTEYSNYLAAGKFLYIKVSPASDCQFFRIYKISVSLSGELTVYAEHIRYILNYYPCRMVTASGLYLFLLNIPVINYGTMPFTFTTTQEMSELSGTIDIHSVRSVGDVLCGSEGSVTDIFGGEWEFNNYTCRLVRNRGTNKNVVLQYGYDINDCNRDIEIQNAYTHIFPYYEWTLEDGSIATITLTHKDLESKYPEIEAADLIKIDNSFQNGDVMKIYSINLATYVNLDLRVGYWNGLNIRSIAESWLSEHLAELLGVKISTTLDFAYIRNNMALNSCELGDTVRVRVPVLNIEATARIRKTEYDTLSECYKSIDVGTSKSGIDKAICGNSKNISKLNVKTTREINMIANSMRQ